MLYPLKNARQIHGGGMDPQQLGVSAPDDHTLVVSLEEPSVYLPALVTTPPFFPLRQDVVEGYGKKWVEDENIVTNGPFLLSQWQHNQRLVLKRNDQYWGPKPQIQYVLFRICSDCKEGWALAAYQDGGVDALGTEY